MLAFPNAFSKQANTALLYLSFFYMSLRLSDSQVILSAQSALELTSNHPPVLSSEAVSCFQLKFEMPAFCRQMLGVSQARCSDINYNLN